MARSQRMTRFGKVMRLGHLPRPSGVLRSLPTCVPERLNLGFIKAPRGSGTQRLRQVGVVPTPLTLNLFNDFIYRDTGGEAALVDLIRRQEAE